MSELSQVHFSEYFADNETVHVDPFDISILRFDDDSLEGVGITEALRKQYGQIALCFELPEDNDTAETHARLEEIFERMPKLDEVTYKFENHLPGEFGPSCIYVYGKVHDALASWVEAGFLKTDQAIFLFEKIEDELLLISADDASRRITGSIAKPAPKAE